MLDNVSDARGDVAVKKDHFPKTSATWIDERMLEGAAGRAELNHHVMQSYFEPLQIYYLGTKDTWLGDPVDIVQGFFESRMQMADFFVNWRSHDMKFRRWLMNAFNFYLKEQRRARKRDRRIASMPESSIDVADNKSDSPQVGYDRAYAQKLVSLALQQAAENCQRAGYGEHWAIFLKHYCDDQGYRQIAKQFSITPERAAVMARTATKRFREAVRAILTKEGAEGKDADQELAALLEDITS